MFPYVFFVEDFHLSTLHNFYRSKFLWNAQTFLKYHQMVEMHCLESYNALINKRNQKGFFVEKVGGVIFEYFGVERFFV